MLWQLYFNISLFCNWEWPILATITVGVQLRHDLVLPGVFQENLEMSLCMNNKHLYGLSDPWVLQSCDKKWLLRIYWCILQPGLAPDCRAITAIPSSSYYCQEHLKLFMFISNIHQIFVIIHLTFQRGNIVRATAKENICSTSRGTNSISTTELNFLEIIHITSF